MSAANDGTELGRLLGAIEDRMARGRAAEAEVYALRAQVAQLQADLVLLQRQLDFYRMRRGDLYAEGHP
jgi:outer membrane protein TolC